MNKAIFIILLKYNKEFVITISSFIEFISNYYGLSTFYRGLEKSVNTRRYNKIRFKRDS